MDTIVHYIDGKLTARDSTRWLGAGGALLWQDREDLASEPDVANAEVIEGRRVYVAGMQTGETGRGDWVVQAYDVPTGEPRWRDQFDSTGQNDQAN